MTKFTTRHVIVSLRGLLITIFSISSASAQTPNKPNIVIILVDDAALMDFGVYGGEAHTPHIDALAKRGAMFTQYRTSPLCSPSRAMLLTGMDNHLTGIATIPEVLPDEHVGQPGYTMHLEPGVLTLADRLRPQGYRTLMTGKWHMGSGDGDLPVNHGFDRSFALDASGADNWEDKSYMPFYADAPWYEGNSLAELPDDFYSSEFIVDKMINYIDQGNQEQPFMAFLGFQAIHIPVQAPPEFTANYAGVYDTGWHELRKNRYNKAMKLGLISGGTTLALIPESDRNWNELNDQEQTLYAARMQVNAGMLEAMDHHIGEFIDFLKTKGQYDNTIFVVTSDNGPEPNRGDNDRRLSLWFKLNGYHTNLENIGEMGSWGFIGPEWANAAASPGALYKFYMTEGGIRAPLIIAGPDITPGRRESMAFVTDIAPTLMDIISPDTPEPNGKSMTGRSLLPVLTQRADRTYAQNEPIGMEVSGNSALYKGNFKITRNMPPVGDGVWRLYDVTTDPGETHDLSDAHASKKAELLVDYKAYEKRVGVLAIPAGYDSMTQIEKNAAAKFLKNNSKMVLFIVFILFMIIFLIIGQITKWMKRRQS